MRKITLGILFVLSTVFIVQADIWDDIRTSTLAPNNGTNGRALPLAGGWQSGWYKYNWGDNRGGTLLEPSYMIDLIKKQHHLLVNIQHMGPNSATTYYSDYMEDALDYLELKNQPIVVLGTQYEQDLYLEDPYKSLPSSTSPRVYTTGQELLNKLSPFPTELSKWYDVGEDWIDGSVGMDSLQSIYPNPPKVIFLSNNESQKLRWTDTETSQRYIDLHSTGQTDNFKRQKVAEGFADCYTEMLDGMLSGLNTNWQSNSIFAGYQNSGAWECFGRWSGWTAYSMHYNSEIAWQHNVWDGGSMSYYLHNNTGGNTDFKVWSIQVAAQNRVFMLEDQLSDNPDFWHELSVWYGSDSHRDWLINTLGQTYNGDRYKGLIQFGMWLLTPRVVRHFGNGWTVSRETEGFEYFDAVMDAVDRVHTDPLLKKFWQHGTLVENTSRTHPYQSAIPTEFSSRSRWFILNTDLDPATPWSLNTEIPVFVLARVMGTTPNREWLVYAHSPLQARTGVEITLPGYGTVTTDVSREGTFVHIKENDNDLIAYYSLNDTANDLSGNGNNGTLVNSPSYGSAKINNGISLSKASHQYINGGRSTILSSSTDELTISLWAKADTLQTEGLDWILAKGSLYYTPKCGYSLRAWHKQLAFFVVGANNSMVSVTGPTLEKDVWYQITAVYKGGEYIKLYVNGVEYSNTTNIPTSIEASSNYDLHIGSGSYCGYQWDGIIDEVKIFNRVLSTEEITDEAHLLAKYDFEEISSGTVVDISGNGNTGTLENSPVLTGERTAGNSAVQLVNSSSQYVNCGRSSSLNGTDELTIDIWAKADTLQESGIDWILGKGSLVSPKSGYSLRLWHKELAFFVVGSSDTYSTVYGPSLEENIWYHIIAVYKGGEYMKLYVNGIEYSNTTNIPTSIEASSSYDLEIGAGSYCGYYWDGQIDEVKIYNKALY
jgi:Concanavalin A-like lectin/glucanases superfamily